MKSAFLTGLVLVAASLLPIVSAEAAVNQVLKPSTTTKTKDDTANSHMTPSKGIKQAIGVVDFENQGNYYSYLQMSENMRAMLESALFATNRFVIVERGNLEAVLQEQDLQASDRAARADSVAQSSKVRSARYLATGTITEAAEETSGDAGGVNISGVHLGGSTTRAHVVVVVKLIDTTTSEVVASQRIRGDAGRTAVNVSYAGHDVGGNLGAFARTPLGEASQDCVNQAVKFISERMEGTPVEGAVVSTSAEEVIINLGENYGVATGQTFFVRAKGEVLTDPTSGEVLGTRAGELIGTVEVTSPREKFSICKLLSGTMPQRGDTVVTK